MLKCQKYGGVTRYFFEVISHLKNMGVNVKVSCFCNKSYYFKDELGTVGSWADNKWISKALTFISMLKSISEMRKGFDIIHPTEYKPYMLGHYSGKLVVTVHDLMHENGKGGTKAVNHLKHKSKIIRAADRIIAISECTKRDLLYYYPEINPENIDVIYHGTSMQPDAHHGKGILPDEKYILYVGGRGNRKNFFSFVKAMNFILKRDKDLKILCVGGGGFNKKELELMGDNFSKFEQVNLNDNELADAYFNAQCFVFPSEYEGFGIPILEAFANNCPVVLSNASCFPEIASNAGEYFNPYDYQDMAEKIYNVINNNSLRNNLISKGRERLKNFSWDKTARETLECYNKALNS